MTNPITASPAPPETDWAFAKYLLTQDIALDSADSHNGLINVPA